MKRNPDYMTRKIAGETVIVPIGDAASDFSGMLHLTETALLIWDRLEDSNDTEDLVRAILSEYDIDEETARHDVNEFLEKLEKRGMIEK